MDEIYGNLENYDEVNTISELRSENKDLKQRLEEYATTTDKLQKDFDSLAAEFKKLEYNYSSLLKTARLEIERKTKIITDLNIEKDKLVLNIMQNVNNKSGLNTRRNVTNDRQSFTKTNKEASDSNIGKAKINRNQSKDCQKVENNETARKEDNQTPSEDMVTSSNTDIKRSLLNIATKVLENMDSCSERNSDSKENITQNKFDHADKANKSQALVKNRRKSMPAASLEHVKFSSDEDNSPAADIVEKDISLRDNKDRTFLNQNSHDKERNKKYATSNIDDKNSDYYESSRDMRKSRSSRYYDSYNYRSRDKSSQRYKKHLSPERLHRKPRDYQEERYRHRILESPSSDKHNDYRHRNREHRSDYERSHAYEHERFRHRHQDRLATKHKIPSDYDEPNNKRLRSDSFNRQHEEVRWHYDKEFKDSQPTEPFDHFHHTSCQSPDYIHSDAQSLHSIREIRHTAITQLEDPRVTSNKYNIRKTHDNNVVLSTVVGRNIDMKPVDKSVWGIKRVDVPNALVQKPLQINEELVKEIYMDIDMENPVSNSSIESGEICFESEQVTAKNDKKGSKRNNDHGKNINTECLKSDFDKYKIPKLKRYGEDVQSQNITKDILLDVPKNTPMSLDFNKNGREKNIHFVCHKNTSKQRADENHDNIPYKNKHLEDINFECQRVPREIVEGDLELSDETSDYTDFQGDATKQNSIQADSEETELQRESLEQNSNNIAATINKEAKQKSTAKVDSKNNVKDGTKLQGHITKQNTNIKIVDNCNENNDSCNIINTKKTKFIEENDDAIMESSKNSKSDRDTDDQINCAEVKYKEETHEDSKRNKGKKKTQKHRETNSKKSLELIDIPHVIDKKSRSKKEKVTKPKEIINKFDDLFGDSSSLITPEDLGLVTEQTSSIPATEYVPIFEDAQDAINLNKIKESTEISSVESNNAVIIKTGHTETSNDIIECKKKSNMNDEPIFAPMELTHTSDIYSNLNSGTSTKETDVVKTVIISTGVQPQCSVENSILQDIGHPNLKTPSELHTVKGDRNLNDMRTTCLGASGLHLNALATSTPQKVLQNSDNTVEIIADASCSSESRLASLDNVIPPTDRSEIQNINAQNDTDVPDVRIVSQSFYRRRRKVGKKT